MNTADAHRRAAERVAELLHMATAAGHPCTPVDSLDTASATATTATTPSEHPDEAVQRQTAQAAPTLPSSTPLEVVDSLVTPVDDDEACRND
jgi:hypothetical protein